MWKWMRKNKGFVWKTMAFILVVIPLIVYALTVLPVFPAGVNNDWAGFWGGYLGAIVGACVAIFVMQKTIAYERSVREVEEKRKFLDEITEKIAQFSASVNKSNSYLLRFHETGEPEWNYEAVYILNDVTRLESVLQIKLLSKQEDEYCGLAELHQEIIKVGEATKLLHQVHVNTFEDLKKEADDVSEQLAYLMEMTAKVVMNNI